MEATKKPTRKRRSKPKVENYYKILGVRANARPERIKESYIQLVKQYPPQQYPEEFQRIRRAYETLRDPAKRQEYDLMRKFGGSIENMLNEAVEYMEQEKWTDAEKLLTQILDISPNMLGAGIGLMHVQILKGDLEQFERQSRQLLERTDSIEDQVKILVIKAKFLLDEDHTEKALDVLQQLQEQYPEYATMYRRLYIHVYQALGREEEVWNLIESELPSVETQEPEHIFLFIEWINAMVRTGKWQIKDKVQKRVRQFLKSIQAEDDKLLVISALIDEYEGFFEAAMFREAELFMDLIHFSDPKHPLVLDERKDLQNLVRIQKEIDRMAIDRDLFPLVFMKASKWFWDEFDDSDASSMYDQMLPKELVQEMEFMHEEMAVGINRLKKRYPIVYRRYQSKWDQLFEEKTAGLNREARRRLGK
ncbi:DnaJ domain-containing protein [Fodinisporobacter ferrooxydans]|uniref:DnaJ domain-containing protein n=1 Tax=Fodinisporobacter ferrooxydans TaxID=2901836 RepID=A0ABY4CLP4_9BACL|nr:DnaJ domain-containing protein [Alicyclobacillaceae bacterium MYW30-H2]